MVPCVNVRRSLSAEVRLVEMSAQVVGVIGREGLQPVKADVVGSILVTRRIERKTWKEKLVWNSCRVNLKDQHFANHCCFEPKKLDCFVFLQHIGLAFWFNNHEQWLLKVSPRMLELAMPPGVDPNLKNAIHRLSYFYSNKLTFYHSSF